MDNLLNLLLVEDSEEDATLVARSLKRNGHPVNYKRVFTADGLRAALSEREWDAILSDHSMPGFDTFDALDILQSSGKDIPFIIVSGFIGETEAVRAMKAGAHDYVMKDNLSRLVPAIEREIAEAASRRAKLSAESALAASERKFRTIVANIPDIVWTVGENGDFVFISANVERITGFSPEEIMRTGMAGMWSSRVHAEDRDVFNIAFRAAFKGLIGGEKLFNLEYRFQRKDCEYIWLNTRGTSSHEMDGQRFMDSVTADISERKRMERMLLCSEKMATIGQLSAGVAHEINNPLSYVMSNYGYLARELEKIFSMCESCPEGVSKGAGFAEKRGEIRALLEESREGINRISKIVRDLKGFARTGGELFGEADIHEMLDSTLNIVNNEIKYKANVVKEYGDVPRVECVSSQINQVFTNLLVNAAQAISKQGEIRLRTYAESGGVAAEISDTGSGISPENLKRIFEPLFTTKDEDEGTGLGLYISNSIVENHHGKISVDSVVGQGTTFKVWLPMRQ
ncbi:MAG: PAS domain S-box protein [Nitrospinae bacterium]|nr:PAS domain S-box protein [Nitrospinota bacterium]